MFARPSLKGVTPKERAFAGPGHDSSLPIECTGCLVGSFASLNGALGNPCSGFQLSVMKGYFGLKDEFLGILLSFADRKGLRRVFREYIPKIVGVGLGIEEHVTLDTEVTQDGVRFFARNDQLSGKISLCQARAAVEEGFAYFEVWLRDLGRRFEEMMGLLVSPVSRGPRAHSQQE